MIYSRKPRDPRGGRGFYGRGENGDETSDRTSALLPPAQGGRWPGRSRVGIGLGPSAMGCRHSAARAPGNTVCCTNFSE